MPLWPNGSSAVVMPCGRCRQLLWEHGGPNCLVQTPSGIKPMSDLLPSAFDAADLAATISEGSEWESIVNSCAPFPRCRLHDHLDGGLRPTPWRAGGGDWAPTSRHGFG